MNWKCVVSRIRIYDQELHTELLNEINQLKVLMNANEQSKLDNNVSIRGLSEADPVEQA